MKDTCDTQSEGQPPMLKAHKSMFVEGERSEAYSQLGEIRLSTENSPMMNKLMTEYHRRL